MNVMKGVAGLLVLCASGFAGAEGASTQGVPQGYQDAQSVQRIYDELDLNRAMQAYRFFYPSVSMFAVWKASLDAGMQPNRTFSLLEASPKKQVLTANSDTPYASMLLDLSKGPMVVEMPPGPLMSLVDDLNQHWVMDLGLPGPDRGKGGRHLVLPPDYQGAVPDGYESGHSTTRRAMLILRALPKGGDTASAIALMKQVKVYPLGGSAGEAPVWIDQSDKTLDSRLLRAEDTLNYWQLLHELLQDEPPVADFRPFYGDLVELGIGKGQPFAPDARLQNILQKAAHSANEQMRVESLADRSADRLVWSDRQWEWAVLRPEGGSFLKPTHLDQHARDKWFFQALGDSPAMFRRLAGAGSLYWLGSHDSAGQYLDGGKTYRLTIAQPVPAQLFWSVTAYDAQTRSQIRNDKGQAALRSLYELRDVDATRPVELYFGPKAPAGAEQRWIQTQPGKGWFAYFRIYGPTQASFDGTWKLEDFEEVHY